MIYQCKSCGGNVVYDPEKSTMHCPYCDNLDSEKVTKGTSTTQCISCGGTLVIGDFISASKCEHCGNYFIVDERVEGTYEPHLILPFKVSKEMAKMKIKEAVGKRAFIPDTFLSEALLKTMEGVYVPFWLYDYNANYDYEGKGTKVKVWTVGNTQFRETSYYSVQRNLDMEFRKLPVDASNALDDTVMDLMEPYQYDALENFQTKYMSGFYGEVYNQTAEQLEERALGKMRTDAELLLRNTISDYSSLSPVKQNLSANNQAKNYALLPLWAYTYHYNNKIYRFHINGQTGKVVGKSPISVKKAVLSCATVFFAILAIASMAVQILEVL